jgi:hypothetical protein
MLGLSVDSINGEPNLDTSRGWNEAERAALHKLIADRQAFIDFSFSRTRRDGSVQRFRVSGEPMFDSGARFIGYRGIGVGVNSDQRESTVPSPSTAQ